MNVNEALGKKLQERTPKEQLLVVLEVFKEDAFTMTHLVDILHRVVHDIIKGKSNTEGDYDKAYAQAKELIWCFFPLITDRQVRSLFNPEWDRLVRVGAIR